MSFSIFISFNGDCKEALEFYSNAFGKSVNGLMTYGEAPSAPGYELPEADRSKVIYAGMNLCGAEVMFCDASAGSKLVKGNNINPTLGYEDESELRRVFGALKEGGAVVMDLQKTFFSELYGMVADKFGITWQLAWEAKA